MAPKCMYAMKMNNCTHNLRRLPTGLFGICIDKCLGVSISSTLLLNKAKVLSVQLGKTLSMNGVWWGGGGGDKFWIVVHLT